MIIITHNIDIKQSKCVSIFMGKTMGTDFLLLQQDAVTVKDRPITIIWLKSFSVIL
jgi:hypothetical protein